MSTHYVIISSEATMNCSKSFSKVLSTLILAMLFGSATVYSQANLQILIFPRSAMSNGMGNVGIAFNLDPSYSFLENPAHVASDVESATFNFGLLPSEKENAFSYDYNNLAFNFGYNFNQNKNSIPLTLGVGFASSKYTYDFESNSRELIHNENGLSNISLGAYFDYGIKFGIGFNVNFYNAEFRKSGTDFPYSNSIKGDGTNFDIGLACQVPMVDAKLSDKHNLNVDLNLGLALKALGDDIELGDYKYASNRNASFGLAIRSGLKTDIGKTKIDLITLDLSSELRDYAGKMDSTGIDYSAPFSNTRVFDNLFGLNGNNKVAVNYGLYLKLFETLHYAVGKSYFGYGTDNFGYGISLDGLMKYLDTKTSDGFWKFVTRHISLTFNHSESSFVLGDQFTYNTIQLNIRKLEL